MAAPGAFGRTFVVPAVNAFMLEHPRVDLELSLTDRRVNLLDQRIDVSIRLGPLSPGVRARALGMSQAVIVCAPALTKGASITGLTELKRLPAVLHGSGARPLGISMKDFRVRLACDDVDTAFEAAIAGIGVTLLPRWRCQTALDTGALVRLLPRLALPRLPVRAVYPGGSRPGRLTRAFVDAVARALPAAFRE